MKKGWNRLALLSLSVICTLIFSGCAMMQIVGASNVMSGSWMKVDKNDKSTLSAFQYINLNMKEHQPFKQYIEKNGYPDYVWIANNESMYIVYIDKEIVSHWVLKYGEAHASKEAHMQYGQDEMGETRIPEVVEHLKAKKIAEETKRAMEEKAQIASMEKKRQEQLSKWQAEQEARDKAREEQRIETEKRDASERQARQEKEAEQARQQAAKAEKARQDQKALEAKQRVEFDDSIWVVKASVDMGRTLLSNNQFVEPARTEGKFVKVTYTVKNKTKSEQRILAVPRLTDAEDRKYLQYDQELNYLEANEKCMVLEALPAGMTKKFVAIYEIPDDAKGLKFEGRSLSMIPDLKYIPFELKKYDPMAAFQELLQQGVDPSMDASKL